jgi:hypothetical protein
MSFVRGVGFEPTTSLPRDSIEAFPRSDATTVPFSPPGLYPLLILNSALYVLQRFNNIWLDLIYIVRAY